MLRVAEQYSGSDTGRQRRENEDALLVRSPLFVVADGMGGAQAGEVASKLAVEAFEKGLPDGREPESALAGLVQVANTRIHELSHANAEQAGMGTTLTAIYVGARDVAIAHVGDSRAYCLRDGRLLRLTDDHSLVDELMRQGRLTPEEAVEHPQRSVITRALGIEGTVDVDTRTFKGRAGDVYLICSDGLTTMVAEERIEQVLVATPRLRDAGEALIAEANRAGGRDNITVVLLRLEEVGDLPGHGGGEDEPTMTGVPAVTSAPADGPSPQASQPAALTAASAAGTTSVPTRRPRAPAAEAPAGRRRRLPVRRVGALVAVLVVLALIVAGAFLAMQSVYFIGTNQRGLVTLYEGVPFTLPGDINLYSSRYVSGVDASTLTAHQRGTLLDHSLRSEGKAASLIHSLELEELE
ncbi:MAG TPA: Stp1/IreP family PP2C-type Ser/Thr phosphatase [Solirubrobacteraceae bacterium]|jgi:serine/threonine protein phosphatase PrpC|nr:Stp1/IreP family PP2C-type Ser/Thr phosphatase [Solirubrobacteraceae bacterium]